MATTPHLRLAVAVVMLLQAARGSTIRPIGAPFSTFCGPFTIAASKASAPSEECWAIVRGEKTPQVGTISFDVSGDLARVNTFDIELGAVEDVASFTIDLENDAIEVEDEAEDLSRFVLQLLGSRLMQLGARRFEPEELVPMINVAADALQCPAGQEELMCCDTDSRPLLGLPKSFVDKHRMLYLGRQADGSDVLSRGGPHDQ